MYDNDDLQRLYGKKYFSHRTRPEMWNRRAEFVLEKFSPKIALDVGCASGEFVKSMIDIGIDAYGIDGSDDGQVESRGNSRQEGFFFGCDGLEHAQYRARNHRCDPGNVSRH